MKQHGFNKETAGRVQKENSPECEDMSGELTNDKVLQRNINICELNCKEESLIN